MHVAEEREGVRAPLRVLLVEDDLDHAELVRRGLDECHANLQLVHVEDGEAALV